jgi:flagellar basal-body rod protein FlgF
MDRLIYIAMSGAKHALEQQATTANNLANLNTTGFRAQLDQFRAVPVQGEGILPTRAFVVDSTVGSDMGSGAIEQTGRDLDVAVQGQGWIAVQTADGSEAYTRNGSLQINENGLLQTASGLPVSSDGGSLSIPPGSRLGIARDGTVSIVPDGSRNGAVTVVGRIKLVNPPQAELMRGDDGLFHLKGGGSAQADPKVNVVQGALESSNVNAINEMVNMITQARAYDLHMKMLQNADSDANKASQLLSLGS